MCLFQMDVGSPACLKVKTSISHGGSTDSNSVAGGPPSSSNNLMDINI